MSPTGAGPESLGPGGAGQAAGAADATRMSGPFALELAIGDTALTVRLSGVPAILARRRVLELPRERVYKAFVLGRSFAVNASPRLPCIGWSSARARIGIFGTGDHAQLWCAGCRPVVLALYLRGEPYHRLVCEVDDVIVAASRINRWLRMGLRTAAPPL